MNSLELQFLGTEREQNSCYVLTYEKLWKMVAEMVPVKGGLGTFFNLPEGKDYKWYISGIYC